MTSSQTEMGFQNSRKAKNHVSEVNKIATSWDFTSVVSGVVSRWPLVGSRPAEMPRQAFESWTSLPNNFSLFDVYTNLIVSTVSASL